MEKFDERKKSFEKKFAHDEELKFKVASRRNKYLVNGYHKNLVMMRIRKKNTFNL